MRTNKETIKLAKIRRLIRNAINWHKTDNGIPYFYTSDNFKKARRVKASKGSSDFYYIKSERAIKEIAEKIFKIVLD